MLRITDKRFHYTPSFSTDLKKRFKKMIRDQERAAAKGKANAVQAADTGSVVPMARRTQGRKG